MYRMESLMYNIDEKRIPGDITNGMYIQFIVSRLDIW